MVPTSFPLGVVRGSIPRPASMRTTTTATCSVELMALVDALVEAIDTDRTTAVDRVRDALAPFGGAGLFDAELRLNGRSSDVAWQVLEDLDVEVAY